MEKKNNFLNRKTMRKMKRQEKKQKKDFFYKKMTDQEMGNGLDKFMNGNKAQGKGFVNSKFNKFVSNQMGNKNINSKKHNERKENGKEIFKKKLYSKNNIKDSEDEDENQDESEIEDDENFDKYDENLDDDEDGDQENELDSQDEEIDSDIPSDKDSVLMDDEYKDEDNKNKNKNISSSPKSNIPSDSGKLDDLDVEIKQLEKKLGIKDGKKFDRFKKKVADENYDDDLFDFLDNIEKIVKEEKVTNTSVSKKSQKSEEVEIKSKSLSNKNDTVTKQKEEKINNPIQPVQSVQPSLDEIKSQSRLFSGLKLSEEDKLKMSFQKEITALLNKISEANLILMFPEFIQKIENFENSSLPKSKKLLIIYETITKVSLKMTLDQEVTNLPITSCICSYISVLHYKFGNSFMLYFMKSLYDRLNPVFNTSIEELETNSNNYRSLLKNFIFVIIHFYILQNLTSKMYFDVIKHFIENFNSIFSETLLVLLSYIGIEIRKEDPESLKEIISSVNKKYNLIKIEQGQQNVSKLKYIVDMIDDIKNNKYMKFNLSEKFNFFKTFVNHNKKTYLENEYDLSSQKIADKVDLSWNLLENFDKNKIEDMINNSEIKNPEKEYLLNNDEEINMLNLKDLDSGVIVDNKILEKKMRKFKMTTDLKKMIFTAIASCSDCSDAFERLMRLNLKRDQAREIVKIIVLLSTEEKCYNPFYKLLLSKLISVDKDHKYTFHYTIWDHMKLLKETDENEEKDNNSFSPKKIHNLAKLTAELLADEKISLPVFLNFEFEDATENQKKFVLTTFDKYFEKVSTPDRCKLLFAKLVKNDDHVEFAKRLFNLFINDFKKQIDLDSKKSEYIENYTAATKVLRRIL
jgi:uncharacterized protein with PIN domain